MNKSIKVLAVAVVMAVSTTAMFAAPKATAPVAVEQQIEITTINGKIKVNKGIYSIKTKENKVYKIEIAPESGLTEQILKANKNKNLILSGTIDEASGVFTVTHLGGMPNRADK